MSYKWINNRMSNWVNEWVDSAGSSLVLNFSLRFFTAIFGVERMQKFSTETIAPDKTVAWELFILQKFHMNFLFLKEDRRKSRQKQGERDWE